MISDRIVLSMKDKGVKAAAIAMAVLVGGG
jgi:hypothetical protein